MDVRLEQFRAGAVQVGPRRAGRKFSREMMALAGDYARSRRGEGASWKEIANALGVADASVKRWAEDAPATDGAFKAVRVVGVPRSATFIVTIGALRVEGLTFESLVALAKALS